MQYNFIYGDTSTSDGRDKVAIMTNELASREWTILSITVFGKNNTEIVVIMQRPAKFWDTIQRDKTP